MDSDRESAISLPSVVEMAQTHTRVAEVPGIHSDLHVRQRTPKKRTMFFWVAKDTPSAPLPAVGRLPNEILLLIFRSMDWDVFDPSPFRRRPHKGLRSLPLVSKAWYGPATVVLYEVVDLWSVWPVFKFHRSLVDGAHLRSYVKTLALPGKVWRTCPPRLMRMFLQIIELADSLEVLHSMCHLIPDLRLVNTEVLARGDHVVLPFSSSKHRQLLRLQLNSDSWDLCQFPDLIAYSFEKLESLALHGFCLMEAVSPQKTPPLPNLIMMTCFYGDAIECLDEWLQSCPKLTTLFLRGTDMVMPSDDTPPLGLLRQGKISNLKIKQMYLNAADNKAAFNWFSKCDSLSVLEIDLSAFSRFQLPLPASVGTLVLRLVHEQPLLSEVVDFLNRNPGVTTFACEVCKHNKWITSHRSRLETEMSNHGVIISFDYVPCYCRSKLLKATNDIMDPVGRWTWRHVKGMRDKAMAEIVDWEFA